METGQQHGSVGLNPGRPTVYQVGCATGPVWARKENVAPTDIRSPNFPVCGESLYPLRYPGQHSTIMYLKTILIKRKELRVLLHYSPPIRSWYRKSVSETGSDPVFRSRQQRLSWCHQTEPERKTDYSYLMDRSEQGICLPDNDNSSSRQKLCSQKTSQEIQYTTRTSYLHTKLAANLIRKQHNSLVTIQVEYHYNPKHKRRYR